MSFHVEKMVSAYISDCRRRVITRLRWLTMLPKCRSLVRNARNLQAQRSHYLFKKQEIGNAILNFLYSTAFKLLWCYEDQKKILEVLHRGGQLFFRSFNLTPLRCLTGVKVVRVLKVVYAGTYGKPKAGFRLFKQLIKMGYCWPILEVGVASSIGDAMLSNLIVIEL